MVKQHLQALFSLHAESEGLFRSYEKYQARNGSYLVVPVSHLELDEIEEMAQLSEFFYQKGDQHVATFVKNKRGEIVSKADDQLFSLLKCPYETKITSRQLKLGEELAKFHFKGRRITTPIQKLVRIGQWKSMWEKRVDQMEQFWLVKMKDHPSDPFERLFIESFPYYVGLTENAIQYLVDTEIDDHPKETDYGTVCHHRFTTDCWDAKSFIRLPTDWVYDHPSRDLVEWIRSTFWQENETSEQYYQFLNDYETVKPLSSFSWRLLYSRLMFPVHYLECIESYYQTGDEEQKEQILARLQLILKRAHRYERLLKDVRGLVQVRRRGVSIPIVNWIG
jgi:spore coat protein YutH